MIEYEPVTAVLRLGDGDPLDPYRAFSAVCTLVYESSTVVWVKAMVGVLPRRQLVELLHWFSKEGIRTVKATRAPDHHLPGFVQVGDHLELDVTTLHNRRAVKNS